MHDDQIKRIKEKLAEAKQVDKNYRVFGASTHKYQLEAPLNEASISNFEEKFNITLPSCYRSFIKHIGNGGAGPFYGISALGQAYDSIVKKKYLSIPSQIPLRVTDEQWDQLTFELDADETSCELYDELYKQLFSGIMTIGSQGCSYMHGIIVCGELSGHVLNLCLDDHTKPKFAFENNFLDWYERWLDEVISGNLLGEETGWFGYSMGGDEKLLMHTLNVTEELQTKRDAIAGLFKLDKLSENSCHILEQYTKSEDTDLRHYSLQALAKFYFKMAFPILKSHLELGSKDQLEALKYINWYAKNEYISTELLKEIFSEITQIEHFRFAVSILKKSSVDYTSLLKPYIEHQDEQFRLKSFDALANYKEKETCFDLFYKGLNDDSPKVVAMTLRAVNGVKDIQLLHSYRRIRDKYRNNDQESIMRHLKLRLKELGINSLDKY